VGATLERIQDAQQTQTERSFHFGAPQEEVRNNLETSKQEIENEKRNLFLISDFRIRN
jgi:hypothetical protein